MKIFILDTDGVLNTGQFFYNSEGKIFKVFGPDDNDALGLLKEHINILFISGDKRGFSINKKRIVDDMGHKLELVSPEERVEWIKKRYEPKEVIFMGDGIFDHYVMQIVGYSIAPNNANKIAKQNADFVTTCPGGNRAVSEACLHIMEKFFEPFK
tara:strand:- start:235 stop:699 length:465 start_codon:yes stop_codon:yes gene_type:complete